MDPRTAISYSLVLCFIVDIGICLSTVEEKNLRSSNPTLLTDNITEISRTKLDDSENKLSKRYRRTPNETYDEEDDIEGAPSDHVVPHSDHEDPEEPSTKPNYTKAGDWAKPPLDRDIPLDFVPTKLYAQVRGTHTVKRVPREEAIETAETAEEILSAPRLREVVSRSKKNTIYTEEGYEDSAYDHAGHIRDADFHEGFAKKLDEKRESNQNSKSKPIGDEKEQIKNEESDSDEDFNEYDDDYRYQMKESSRVEEAKPLKRSEKKSNGEEYKSIKNLWQNPDINPKLVTENEIKSLEEYLKKEYAESEKNVEDQVPANLKNTGSDYDHEADEFNSEEQSANEQDYEKQTHKNNAESREALSEISKNRSDERFKYENNEFPVVSSTKVADKEDSTPTSVNPTGFRKGSANPAGFAVNENFQNTQSLPEELPSTTPNYGKIFWNYFKLEEDKWKPKEVSTPSENAVTVPEAVNLNPDELTTFASAHTTLRDFDTLGFSPPSTESSDFVFASSSVDPRAASLYESWKRQSREGNSQESPEFRSVEVASNSYPMGFGETTKYEVDPAMDMNRDDNTVLIAPKKRYTVIIRSDDKTTTTSPPCNRKVYKEPERKNSIVHQLTSPRYTKMLNYLKDQPSPQEINDIAVHHQDFTVFEPPLPVPLRQVTYADFLANTYGSPVRQSVTEESGQLGKQVNGERDRYHGIERPHDKRLVNLFSHASESPHFHHHRGHHSPPGYKTSHLHHHLPPTKLIPPSPMVRSKYAEYLGVEKPGKPRTRFNRSPGLDPWPELLQLYRSIDRSIFGRREKRSIGSELIIEEPREIDERKSGTTAASNDRGKVDRESFDGMAEKNRQSKRNFFQEGANRLVALDATGAVDLSSNENFQREKSSEIRRKRNHEDLLNETSRIANEEINAEIESRFKNEEEDEEAEEEKDEEKYDDSSEKERGEIDIQVPDFNVSEVIENNKNERIISNHPTKANKLDFEKYPFYENSKVPQSSALKYITNPRQVPRKTLGGTEFYDSRDRYLECDEVEPNLESVVPEEEGPVPEREPRGDEPRLRGLGDKLDCFRAKYFDENPLDNPLFLEKQIDQPRVPEEFDPAQFVSRITGIPSQNLQKREVVARVSRKPEIDDLGKSGSKRIQVAQKDKQNSRTRNNEIPRRGKEQSTKNRRSRRKRPERRGRKKKSERTSTEPPQHYQVTPYQRQVYEDVMGTIQNLEGMYQAFGESVSNPSVQSNANHVPVGPREKDWNYPTVRITERPRGFLIPELSPLRTTAASEHQPLQRYRVIPYRTNKVSYRTRVRKEGPAGGDGVKVGYFRTVRVHKRSIDDSGLSGEPDTDVEESRNIAVSRIKNLTNSTSLRKTTTQDTEGQAKPAASERVVYTIRDRIKYSKPRGDSGKNGRFSNLEAAGTEDVRRQEPRYNQIRRKIVPASSTSDPHTTTYGEHVEEVDSTADTLKPLTEQDRTTGRHDFHDEPGEIYKIQFSMTQGTQAAPTVVRRRYNEDSMDAEEDYEEEKESEKSRKDKTRKNHYDVHENVEEDVTTVSNFNVEPTTAPEFFNLQEYLQSDPPGYSEAFSESSTESTSRYEGKKNKKQGEKEVDDEDEDEEPPTKSYQRTETRRDNERKQEGTEDEEQGGDEQVDRPSESYGDEESSLRSEEAEDGPDAPVESESYKNAEDDEEETKDDESSHDGEKEFNRFASRPYSPFESYEDPKYSDLGPRINKPAFYHPRFSKPTSRKNGRDEYSAESDDDESEEDGREKPSRYIFPWEEDEPEGVEESKNSGRSIGRYEYPWEKRERLAKERRKKEKARREYEKFFRFSDDSEDDAEEEEQNSSETKLRGRRVYPWEHYDVPSKDLQRGKIPRSGEVIDNVEVGTEYRPVTKFSSRYKSRAFSLNDNGDSIVVSGADPSKIRLSVIESVKKASETTPVDSIEVLKNIGHGNASKVAASTVANSYRVPERASTTIAPRKPRNWKSPSMSTTTTRLTGTSPSPKSWRIASTTTKKPIRSRKRISSLVDNELLKSGSQRKEVTTTNPGRRDYSNSLTITPLETTTASVVNRKIRLRGQSIKRSHNFTATTVRPVRRRLSKSTVAPKAVEETTVKSVTERATTPNSKTVEHRSSFSKEEIITMTSYPRLDTDSHENERSVNESKKLNNLMNESVKKVSIVTKETPDHIYRTEEIDKDGVKGMFVSITPNNGTSASLDSMEGPEDRTIDNEDTKEVLKRFENFDDKKKEQDAGSSSIQESHLMANLLRQVPPFMNDLKFDESFQGGNHFLETEESGDGESDEDAPYLARTESRSNYEKNPSNRLYYYVEK